ncbi:hypothetical protein [Photobacterium carnosum]|uniref:hypothetical protein n=2 Tax=Photobacterium carnosum TaxID=2023717 RepID=UPI001E658447|nr:hypothetical protein [Photobacterium carnosum]MCD9523630.1 hypothetical protein [Photobacterium carnosum]MCD9528551.1 hypothetical protein [Photobacterium carnosum]MCD9536627.1 hypothetical protein [Photobacterium carnosum]MCD9543636.1 hypothetical protein [Photobacterium carnosum]MCF2152858.1 hypothetical protein [Photobacterium carnosum]
MLTLAYNHPAIPAQERRLQQFIVDNAPILAFNAIATSYGDITYIQLQNVFNHQLAQWWILPHDNPQPANQYEASYWTLIQTLNGISDYQLMGDSFIQHKVVTLSCYLLNIGPCPQIATINRP